MTSILFHTFLFGFPAIIIGLIMFRFISIGIGWLYSFIRQITQ